MRRRDPAWPAWKDMPITYEVRDTPKGREMTPVINVEMMWAIREEAQDVLNERQAETWAERLRYMGERNV